MKSGKVFHVRESEIDLLEWMHVARGYEIKVIAKDGAITKFGGFKENVSLFTYVCMFIFPQKYLHMHT